MTPVGVCNHGPEGSGFPTIPFHIPFRHSSPVIVDSLSLSKKQSVHVLWGLGTGVAIKCMYSGGWGQV